MENRTNRNNGFPSPYFVVENGSDLHKQYKQKSKQSQEIQKKKSDKKKGTKQKDKKIGKKNSAKSIREKIQELITQAEKTMKKEKDRGEKGEFFFQVQKISCIN